MIMACFKYLQRFGILLCSLSLIQTTLTKICHNIDIRNDVEALRELDECSVVEGFVKIVLMERANETEFELYSFPKLREITDYLLLYRIFGLRSLGKLFPNLEIIRGNYLYEDFALVVVEMIGLVEIDLWSLREISRGSVIFFKNPNLCFIDTKDWNQITRRPSINYKALNQSPRNCPRVPPDCPRGMFRSGSRCQRTNEEDCHPLCVGSCHSPGPRGCYACHGLFSPRGECVSLCPDDTYQYLNRRCVTQSECHSIQIEDVSEQSSTKHPTKNYLTFESTCVPSCPPGYEIFAGTTCKKCNEGRCKKECKGANINSMQDAQNLKGCTNIDGSIEVSIKSENSETVRKELEENLGSIEVITGYLKVSRSSLTDLKFFKHLSTIQGKSTMKFSLEISRNPNLKELWDWDTKKNLTIAEGMLFFHYNPKLCLQHIYKLREIINYTKNFTDLEISKESNGDKFPCHEINIEVNISRRSYDYIEIHVPYIYNMFRYVFYYVKDPYKNVKIFDDLNPCSDDGWRTKDISVGDDFETSGFLVNVTDLEPDTQYAFYFTTYTIDSIGATSNLNYVSTLPTIPTELTSLNVFSNSSSTIVLEWRPPGKVNGKLSEYIVTWIPLEEDESYIRQRDYCENPMTITYESDDRLDNKPKKKIEHQDCCNDVNDIEFDQSKELEQFCSTNFKSQNNDLKLKTTKISLCEPYFYSYIQAKQFSIHDTFDKEKNSNENLKILKHKHEKTKPKSNTKIENDNNNSVIKQKSIRLPPHSSSVVINGLKHFQKYVVTVKGCRELHEDEEDLSEDLRCSKAEMEIVRTHKNESADKIIKVRHDLIERTLFVYWDTPENPNGLVVAFEIQYQRRDSVTLNQITECVTYTKYEKSNGYSIKQIPLGRYKFRLRSISLSGKGPFTDFISFDVVDATFSFIGMAVIILINLVIVCLIVLFFIFYMKKTESTVIDEVDPNYHYIPDDYEFPREDVEFVQELGEGRFGRVYRGVLKPTNKDCAIKTISDDASENYRNEFFCEATTMKSMSQAYHIVKLLGVVSVGNPPLLLMELMELGDLKTYLRSLRETQTLGSGTMIQIASEIADAMAFMEAKKFVHRDLAARNCMVSSTRTIKIGDFGMARNIYETDYYRMKNRGLLPIRWMAPESLQDGEFTSQSDAWSYGVVLWEVVTMAEQPYQGSSNDEVLQQVMAGRKLEIPGHCPVPLKILIKSCWFKIPKDRFSFMQIMSSLKFYHDDEFRRVAYYYSAEASASRDNSWEYVEMQPLLESNDS